ncbi:MAG: Flp pilus assembly complex ATPase component TadA [Clostridia bacterium]|nr:Flp pilus assembly complex ATPase component TadA [Clostridia bacterium]
MDVKRRQPIGIELVKRGLITEDQIQTALDYQKTHPSERLGDIIHDLNLCDPYLLIQAIGDIFGEKSMLVTMTDVKVQMDDYISVDVLRQNSAVIFDVVEGRAKVCFSDISNRKSIDTVRLLLLNRGIVMDRFVTFKSNIDAILSSMGGKVADKIGIGTDVTSMVDSIIKTGMDRRASDIHFEPMDNKVRIRYRIDGQLFDIAEISKDKQQQLIGRLKAISNMHQEKQESQDR